jgi:hypothetical protein
VNAKDADFVDAGQSEASMKNDDRQRGVGTQPLEIVDADRRL